MTKKYSDDQEKFTIQAKTLVELVGYQDGSIVSRTLIDRKSGNATLFAFDEGQGLSEHAAPYDVIVYILEGGADVVISDESIRLGKGEITVIPAGESHALLAITKFKMLLIMIRS